MRKIATALGASAILALAPMTTAVAQAPADTPNTVVQQDDTVEQGPKGDTGDRGPKGSSASTWGWLGATGLLGLLGLAKKQPVTYTSTATRTTGTNRNYGRDDRL